MRKVTQIKQDNGSYVGVATAFQHEGIQGILVAASIEKLVKLCEFIDLPIRDKKEIRTVRVSKA